MLKEYTKDDGGDDLTLHSFTTVHDFNYILIIHCNTL